jgi:hypothetical protein
MTGGILSRSESLLCHPERSRGTLCLPVQTEIPRGGLAHRWLTRNRMPHPWRFHGWVAMSMSSLDLADLKLRRARLIDQNRAK